MDSDPADATPTDRSRIRPAWLGRLALVLSAALFLACAAAYGLPGRLDGCDASLDLSLQELDGALAIYAAKNKGNWPEHLEDASVYLKNGEVTDPWGNAFVYARAPSADGPSGYVIVSLGPDGEPGTKDDTVHWR